MRPPRWALLSATVVPVALIVGWIAGGAVQPPGYDPVRQTISALAATGAAHRWIMTVGLYAVGVGHLVTAAGLRGTRAIARIVLAVGGLAGVGLAYFHQPAHGSSAEHITFTAIGFVALGIFPVLVADRTARRFPLRPAHVVFAGALSAVLLIWLALTLHGSTTLGVSERVLTAQQEIWPLLVVLALRAAAHGPDGKMAACQPPGRSSCSAPPDRSAPKRST